MKKRKKNLINSTVVFLVILSISCQSAPVIIMQDEAKALEREILPPDEKTLNELHEVSELARSYRQKLISSGIPNFSFNDWQIASTLYDRTVQEEKTGTIRETQESIARYQLTAAILETLYLSAVNPNPVGGSSELIDDYGYETAWSFDDPVTASTIPPPNSLILSQIPASSQRPAGSTGFRNATEQQQVTEKDKEPGKGLYIPDIPSRDELRIATMIVSGVDPEDIVIPESPNTSASSFTAPPTTRQALTETEQAAAAKVDLAEMPVSAAAIAIVTRAPEAQASPAVIPSVPGQSAQTAPSTETAMPDPVTSAVAAVSSDDSTAEGATTSVTAATPASATSAVAPAPAAASPSSEATSTATATSTSASVSTANAFSRYPSQYKVISWDLYKDCLWMIAYRVYNDPKKWRIIYEANRHKMRSPDNPDLIFPGEILDIPSLDGEERTGMWDGSMGYTWKEED